MPVKTLNHETTFLPIWLSPYKLGHNGNHEVDINLQEPNLDEVTEDEKLDMDNFRITVKEDDVNKCRILLL